MMKRRNWPTLVSDTPVTHMCMAVFHPRAPLAHLHVAVVHEDPLQVEQAGVLEDLPTQLPDVVAAHAENLQGDCIV